MIVDCIADLHGEYPVLKGGDLLIIGGDLTARDTPLEHINFYEWLREQPYSKKIMIAGNHDNFIQSLKSKYFPPTVCYFNCEYLCDSGTEFEGLKIWGSPWTKKFPGINPHCCAFTVENDDALAEKWKLIPEDTDILVCHSPMWGMHDTNRRGERCGSQSLLRRHVNHHLNKLGLFVCGHIHEGYGVYDIRKYQKEVGDPIGTVHVNASIMNGEYEAVNKPIRVIL